MRWQTFFIFGRFFVGMSSDGSAKKQAITVCQDYSLLLIDPSHKTRHHIEIFMIFIFAFPLAKFLKWLEFGVIDIFTRQSRENKDQSALSSLKHVNLLYNYVDCSLKKKRKRNKQLQAAQLYSSFGIPFCPDNHESQCSYGIFMRV